MHLYVVFCEQSRELHDDVTFASAVAFLCACVYVYEVWVQEGAVDISITLKPCCVSSGSCNCFSGMGSPALGCLPT